MNISIKAQVTIRRQTPMLPAVHTILHVSGNAFHIPHNVDPEALTLRALVVWLVEQAKSEMSKEVAQLKAVEDQLKGQPRRLS